MPNHRRTHPNPVDECWACKVMTVGFAAAAMPTRYPEPVRVDAKEAALTKDLLAYRRLRHAGFQPKTVDGSASLERMEPSCQFEIDTGHLIPKAEMPRVQESIAVAKETGLWTDGGR